MLFRSPHDTAHTVEESWPLMLGTDERGRSIHVCIVCHVEVPDGAAATRDGDGVVVWTGKSPVDGVHAGGTSETVIFHDCSGVQRG